MVKYLPASAEDARDVGSTPRLGSSSAGGRGHPLQSSCLGNPMDRRAWLAAVPGAAKGQTRLSTHIGACCSSCMLSLTCLSGLTWVQQVA